MNGTGPAPHAFLVGASNGASMPPVHIPLPPGVKGSKMALPPPGKGKADGAGSSQPPSHMKIPGDWNCSKCGDLQFARNPSCRKCGADRPDSAGPIEVHASQKRLPGDWRCPGCNDHQFARNSTCRRCGTPKPIEAGGTAGVAPPPAPAPVVAPDMLAAYQLQMQQVQQLQQMQQMQQLQQLQQLQMLPPEMQQIAQLQQLQQMQQMQQLQYAYAMNPAYAMAAQQQAQVAQQQAQTAAAGMQGFAAPAIPTISADSQPMALQQPLGATQLPAMGQVGLGMTLPEASPQLSVPGVTPPMSLAAPETTATVQLAAVPGLAGLPATPAIGSLVPGMTSPVVEAAAPTAPAMLVAGMTTPGIPVELANPIANFSAPAMPPPSVVNLGATDGIGVPGAPSLTTLGLPAPGIFQNPALPPQVPIAANPPDTQAPIAPPVLTGGDRERSRSPARV